MAKAELYDYPLSSSAARVRIALAYKGLDYRSVPLDLKRGAQREADFRALNPQGLVPAYSDGQILLTQSLAIIEYLEELHPTPALLPASPVERARARQFAQMIASDMQPLLGLRVMGMLRAAHNVDVRGRTRWFQHWLNEGLDALELWLTARDSPGRYCVGDAPSIADVCLVPQLEVARRVGLDIDDFPRLLAVEEQCRELAAFAPAIVGGASSTEGQESGHVE